MPDGSIVTPEIRDAERLQGFPADWTLPATRVAKAGLRWKLVGNAVSVPAARWLGRRLGRPARDVRLDSVEPLRLSGKWPDAAWNVGEGRFTATVSAWPEHRARKPLATFLKFPPKPLSARATAGFLERTGRSSLRFPTGFIAALESHLARCR
jgi:DNA (cytosine-5)-methyltransferase 1